MPLYMDDVKDDKFLAKLTEGFDDGEVYETSEGEFVGMDEDSGSVDGEADS